ncbi:MAG: nickel pincer cofactor biosynthesis protein LarC [Planctomycetes bacterium]|nr:nickel pincer cofactor biosynthesis protein LarC [Planctomycetota bacterium]
MTTLYIEPFSGLAGDMFLAALLDLGDERFQVADLEALARALVPGECTLSVTTAWRGNLSGKLLDVRTDESTKAPHRHLSDLLALLDRAPRELLPERAKQRAGRVFRRIAEAEGRVHGCAPEEIHFHEVGAVDTLIDVAGAMCALERLGVTRVLAHAPVTGTGTVKCAHGEMPVPAPAVAELLRGRALDVSGGGGERLTPTGAALLAELVERFEHPGPFAATKIGYGAGHKDPKVGPPNLVRVQLGELAPRAAASVAGTTSASTPSNGTRAEAWLCEVNLDDMTGEELAHAARAVRERGALDVWTTSVLMKKERPGVVLSALCRSDTREAIEAALFEHTSTLGMRWTRVERTECGRRTIEVALDGHALRVKVRERPCYEGASALGERDLSPEHDDVARIASATGLSLREVERRAIAQALRGLA